MADDNKFQVKISERDGRKVLSLEIPEKIKMALGPTGLLRLKEFLQQNSRIAGEIGRIGEVEADLDAPDTDVELRDGQELLDFFFDGIAPEDQQVLANDIILAIKSEIEKSNKVINQRAEAGVEDQVVEAANAIMDELGEGLRKESFQRRNIENGIVNTTQALSILNHLFKTVPAFTENLQKLADLRGIALIQVQQQLLNLLTGLHNKYNFQEVPEDKIETFNMDVYRTIRTYLGRLATEAVDRGPFSGEFKIGEIESTEPVEPVEAPPADEDEFTRKRRELSESKKRIKEVFENVAPATPQMFIQIIMRSETDPVYADLQISKMANQLSGKIRAGVHAKFDMYPLLPNKINPNTLSEAETIQIISEVDNQIAELLKVFQDDFQRLLPRMTVTETAQSLLAATRARLLFGLDGSNSNLADVPGGAQVLASQSAELLKIDCRVVDGVPVTEFRPDQVDRNDHNRGSILAELDKIEKAVDEGKVTVTQMEPVILQHMYLLRADLPLLDFKLEDIVGMINDHAHFRQLLSNDDIKNIGILALSNKALLEFVIAENDLPDPRLNRSRQSYESALRCMRTQYERISTTHPAQAADFQKLVMEPYFQMVKDSKEVVAEFYLSQSELPLSDEKVDTAQRKAKHVRDSLVDFSSYDTYIKTGKFDYSYAHINKVDDTQVGEYVDVDNVSSYLEKQINSSTQELQARHDWLVAKLGWIDEVGNLENMAVDLEIDKETRKNLAMIFPELEDLFEGWNTNRLLGKVKANRRNEHRINMRQIRDILLSNRNRLQKELATIVNPALEDLNGKKGKVEDMIRSLKSIKRGITALSEITKQFEQVEQLSDVDFKVSGRYASLALNLVSHLGSGVTAIPAVLMATVLPVTLPIAVVGAAATVATGYSYNRFILNPARERQLKRQEALVAESKQRVAEREKVAKIAQIDDRERLRDFHAAKNDELQTINREVVKLYKALEDEYQKIGKISVEGDPAKVSEQVTRLIRITEALIAEINSRSPNKVVISIAQKINEVSKAVSEVGEGVEQWIDTPRGDGAVVPGEEKVKEMQSNRNKRKEELKKKRGWFDRFINGRFGGTSDPTKNQPAAP